MHEPRNRPLRMAVSPRSLNRGAAALALALLAVTGGCRGRDRELPPELPRLVQATVEAEALPAEVRKEKERRRAWAELRRFYAKRAYQPAWIDAGGPRPQAQDLLTAIDAAGPEGLDPALYNRTRLEGMLAEAEKIEDLEDPQAQRRLVDLDVHLTHTFLTLAAHLATGRLQPDTLRTAWYTEPRNVDLDGMLARALASDDREAIRANLGGLLPPSEDYRRLRDALARYREIAARGGWLQVPAGPNLKRGATGARVAALRERLAAEGDLPAAAAAPGTGNSPAPGLTAAESGTPARSADERAPAGAAREDGRQAGVGEGGREAADAAVFDDALAAAVARFQRRHGLDATGVVDADTLEALDVPAEERVRQIAVNMERWRWMPSSLGERYILVNVPEFEMKVVENGREALAMRVVVGKTQSQTPVFSDRMTYLELNPAWNLPDSIVRNEVMPALARDPSYLERKNMEVVASSPFRLRQRPGPDNPLGRVKFMFPNEFDVYLHDTPADHLFSREERDFSHGCIRVEYPVKLAEYLLKDDPRWRQPAIAQALASGEGRTITLKKPLPVHILYWTAWVEKDGTVQFRKDIYGHDARLAGDLAKEPPITLDLDALRREQRAGAGADRAAEGAAAGGGG